MKPRKSLWLARKDLKESLSNPMVVAPMIVLPLVVCVVLPAALIILGLKGGIASINGTELIERILPLYRIPARFTDLTEKLLYVFLNFTVMPFFTIIPVMSAAVLSANSVAGEKERHTLETLLYAPITNRELVAGKLLSAFVPSMAASLGSFALYFATANGLYLAMRGKIVVDSPAWIPAIGLLVPAASLLGLGCSLLASIKAKSFIEAQQASALAVLPCLGLIGAQMGGLAVMSPFGVAAAALVLFGADYLLLAVAAPRFAREKIIAGP
jgi:ABC-2 type transport system permease protein